MKKAKIISVLLAMFMTASVTPFPDCTGIMLRTKDGAIVHGRTAEFGTYIETSIAFVPRGYKFKGQTPLGDGMSYSAKYAVLGTITYEDVKIIDGFNEEGLAVGAFYFPTFAGYTPTTKDNKSKSLSPGDFPNWLLTQFSSIDEVKRAIEAESVYIAPTVLEGWGPEAPPFHYVVYDKEGNSVVIEPVDGKLNIHDNPIGAMSNSPTFDWHMTNLRNYVSLNPRNVPPVEVSGVTFKQLGQGSGMFGLPGDFTPPSRFVRAAVFSSTAIPSENAEKGVEQVFHILNNFDIPVGVAREEAHGQVHTDYTMLTVARDPQSLTYYYKSYDDQTIRKVSMGDLDKNGKEILLLNTRSEQPIVDMTKELK
ncbi:MAG: choloylglycine hydrolase family protein [Bacteroidota bacterium]